MLHVFCCVGALVVGCPAANFDADWVSLWHPSGAAAFRWIGRVTSQPHRSFLTFLLVLSNHHQKPQAIPGITKGAESTVHVLDCWLHSYVHYKYIIRIECMASWRRRGRSTGAAGPIRTVGMPWRSDKI